MTLLTRDQVFAVDDMKTLDVEVPEWGGIMRVRCLTGSERSQVEKMLTSGTPATNGKVAPHRVDAGGERLSMLNWRQWLVARTAIDENKKPVFTVSDITALGNRSAAPLARVAEAVLSVSGISKAEQEEMEKNSEGTTTDDGS